MAPKPTTSRNGALWVIALSLVVIAGCLVLMVIHPQDEMKIARPDSAQIQPSAPNSGPIRARVLSSNRVKPESDVKEESTAPRVEAEVARRSDATQPEVIPVVAGERFSSTGLAPLTFLGTNDGGAITGKVILKGTPPPETQIQLDAVCGKLHKTPMTTHRYVVSKDGGLANVFVYIASGLPNHTFPIPQPTVLNQVGCEFQPLVVGLMTQQTLIITNSDKFLHNLHATPHASGNSRFNLAEGGGGTLTRQFFAEETPIRIYCDVHPWMHADVCVVDNPFFAVTDSDGNFIITNVPPGSYVLDALHFRKPEDKPSGIERAVQKISVNKGEIARADFVIELPDSTKQASR